MIQNTLRVGDVGAEVATLQCRLNSRGAKLDVDNVFGSATDAALRAFQLKHHLVADGIAGPRTQAALLGHAADPRALTQKDIEAAASALQCDAAAIQAVISVESPRGGFLPDGRVVILFERHIFYRLLREAGVDPAPFVAKRPDICNTQPGGYLGGAQEYGRLAAASQINADCARESASWGRFQIMGEHWSKLGYDSVAAFVADQATGEAAQLRTFIKWVQLDESMLAALRDHAWPVFAEYYNGPAYAKNHYAAKLARDYALHAGDTHDTPKPAAVAAVATSTDASKNAGKEAGASRRGKRAQPAAEAEEAASV